MGQLVHMVSDYLSSLAIGGLVIALLLVDDQPGSSTIFRLVRVDRFHAGPTQLFRL